MKLENRPLIWKNGRAPSNTYKHYLPLGLVSAVQKFLISSPKLRPNPPFIFKSQPAPRSARKLRCYPFIHLLQIAWFEFRFVFVFITSSGSKCTLESVHAVTATFRPINLPNNKGIELYYHMTLALVSPYTFDLEYGWTESLSSS